MIFKIYVSYISAMPESRPKSGSYVFNFNNLPFFALQGTDIILSAYTIVVKY